VITGIITEDKVRKDLKVHKAKVVMVNLLAVKGIVKVGMAKAGTVKDMAKDMEVNPVEVDKDYGVAKIEVIEIMDMDKDKDMVKILLPFLKLLNPPSRPNHIQEKAPKAINDLIPEFRKMFVNV